MGFEGFFCGFIVSLLDRVRTGFELDKNGFQLLLNLPSFAHLIDPALAIPLAADTRGRRTTIRFRKSRYRQNNCCQLFSGFPYVDTQCAERRRKCPLVK